MKMVSVTLEVPKETDEFYRREAKRRVISKSAVIREVLIKHVRKQLQHVCPRTQSAQAQ